MQIQKSTKAIINKWMPFVAGYWVIGIALKFLTFQIILNQNLYAGNVLTEVFFPYFPNVFDVLLIVCATIYLMWSAGKREP